jgi:heat shock protein HtpX
MMFQGGLRFGGGRSSGDSDRGKGGAGVAIVIALALIAVAWLLSVVIRLALSRQREYLADAGSVELTKDPDAMISALRKIEGRGELAGATSAVMEMCIDNPRGGFENLFDTHPSIESRIKALIDFAGGHDPGPLELPPEQSADTPESAGPWGAETASPPRPFLPGAPPVTLGEPPAGETPAGPPGPWGPARRD